MKKLIGIMLAVCMIVPLAAGCGKKEEPQPSGAAPTQTAVSTGRDPLNGSETISEYKPVIAMIDNSEAARPQEGIQAADIVYECEVEGGITRLMGGIAMCRTSLALCAARGSILRRWLRNMMAYSAISAAPANLAISSMYTTIWRETTCSRLAAMG